MVQYFVFNFRKCQDSGGVYKTIHHPFISHIVRCEIIQYFIPYTESGEKFWSTGKHCFHLKDISGVGFLAHLS